MKSASSECKNKSASRGAQFVHHWNANGLLKNSPTKFYKNQSESQHFENISFTVFIWTSGMFSDIVRHFFTLNQIFVSWISILFIKTLMYQFLRRFLICECGIMV